MPQILLKLIALCQNHAMGSARAVQLVAQDPGMASTVLGLAHGSAERKHGREIGIAQAMRVLGEDMFRTLVVNESALRMFDAPGTQDVPDMRAFWKRSLTAALTAREIASHMSYPFPEEAYLAGLLHDIGRLALAAAAPHEYAVNFHAPDDAKLCWTEQRTLQITHGEAGAWLIERWQLDSFLADSVLYHHEPVQRLADAHPLIRIGLLAHLLTSRAADDEEVLQASALCGIEGAELDLLQQGVATQVQALATELGIDLTGIERLKAPDPAPAGEAPDKLRQQMAEAMRGMMLTADAERSFARQSDQQVLLEMMRRSAQLLFQFDDALLLVRSATRAELRGVPLGERRQRLADFSISLSGSGVLARAAAESRLATILRQGALLDVGEEQLLNLLGTEALICLPLMAAGRCEGMIVGGVAADSLAALPQREEFMLAFGAQAGAAVLDVGQGRTSLESQLLNMAEEYREASRKAAHEVNNPLSIIKNYLSILDSKLRRKEPVAGELSILNEEIDRVGQIVRGLAEHQPALGPGSADVGRVARQVIRLFRDTEFIPANVRLTLNQQEPPSTMAGNPDLLKQILLNLVKNAIEALSDGGEIDITDHGYIHRDGRLYVELSVRDSGPGIDADVLAHLFAPGHSTKDGVQRGLGLSIVHGLVTQMHGTILCRSGNAGTTFQLLLPAPSAQAGGETRNAVDKVEGT